MGRVTGASTINVNTLYIYYIVGFKRFYYVCYNIIVNKKNIILLMLRKLKLICFKNAMCNL